MKKFVKTALRLAVIFCFLNVAFAIDAKITRQPLRVNLVNPLQTLILAELAVHNGEYQYASKYYLLLANQQKEAYLAKQATLMALKTFDITQTTRAAMLWGQIQPNNFFPQFVATTFLINANRSEESLPFLKTIYFQNEPDATLATTLIYNGLSNKKAKNNFFHELERLAKAYPKHSIISYNLALIALDQQELDVALKAINHTLQLNKKWPEAIGLRAQILIAKKQDNDAIHYLQQQLNRTPEDVFLKSIYGRVLLDSNQLASAQQQFQALLKDPQQNAQALIDLGQIAYQQQQFSLAIDLLTKALAYENSSNTARYLLGQIAEEQKHVGEAIAWYKSITSGRYIINATINAALLLGAQGKVDDAIHALNNLNQVTPSQYKSIILAKATILNNANLPYQALGTLRNGLVALPNDIDFLYARSQIQANTNDIQNAEEDLKQILKQEPDNVLVLNNLGYMLASQTNRYTDALDYLKQALALAPQNPMVLDSIGWLHFRMGEKQTALNYLKKAFAITQDGPIAIHLGEVLWALGKRQEAMQIWQNVLNKFPENQELINTITRYKNY